MKKNFIYGMMAIASMLFATSCSQDVLQDETANLEYIDASFEVKSPEGISSRAIGEGQSVNKLVCATFDANGTELNLRETMDFGVNQTATYKVRLVKGQDYRVAFFAYYAEEGNDAPKYYDIKDLKNIEIYDGQLSNIEERDAFTAYCPINIGETMKAIHKEVILYRPFAQLNLGTEKQDWEAAMIAGVEIEKTKVTVSNVYKAFSAYDDAVVGEASTMVFELNTLPNQWLKADANNDKTDEEYKYLALNYLLVGDIQKEMSLTDVKFEWQCVNNGNKNNPITEYNNIPVQRNHRTNILGWLLTNPAEFEITIDEEFEKPDFNVDAAEKENQGGNGNEGDDNTGNEGEGGNGNQDSSEEEEGDDTPEKDEVTGDVNISEYRGTNKGSNRNPEYTIENKIFLGKVTFDGRGTYHFKNVTFKEVIGFKPSYSYGGNNYTLKLEDCDLCKEGLFDELPNYVSLDLQYKNCKVNGVDVTEANKATLLGTSEATPFE